MRTRLSSHSLILSALVLMLAVAPATFGEDSVARTIRSVDTIAWQPYSASAGVELTIAAPDGRVYTFDIAAGDSPSFRAEDLPGGALDGYYRFELRAISRTSRSRTATPEDNRTDGSLVQSGGFLVRDGAFVSTDRVEARRTEPDGKAERTTNAGWATPPTAQPEDQTIFDDLIVDGSLCVGLDCVNGEAFGFDTIRLKENNTRILFLDTSSSASFPRTDWQLTANETINGGLDLFSIEDISAGRIPFTVLGGAPNNSIYVDGAGRLGLRTATPALDVHLKTGNTPAIRLDQDGTKGFSPRAWDIGGNEVSFFIRDVNASSLRLEILPNGSWRTSTGATLTMGGVWTNSSSIHLKQDVMELDTEAATRALLGLTPVTFAYKIDPSEQYVGFIAEDVPDLVATNDRETLSPMDVVAVLTKVVQDQQKTIEDLTRRLEELEREPNHR